MKCTNRRVEFKDRQLSTLHRELHEKEEVIRELKLKVQIYETGMNPKLVSNVQKDSLILNLQKQLATKKQLIDRQCKIVINYEPPGQNSYIKTAEKVVKAFLGQCLCFLAGPKAYRLIR